MSNTTLTVSIGTDHAGFPLKEPIIRLLHERGHQVIDCGCTSKAVPHDRNLAL
ncbi:MAG: RpiB/LacA/LacB family sugar-phosphate isomerase [Opitutae bacterium]|nr:RpiB/LacA/LacB family sugar-phosphate isomerase [Opitutae bacterium]